MKQGRLLIVVILSGLLMGCLGPIKEKTYLQEYGCKGGRGQGFRASPYRVSQGGDSCVPGKISGRITHLRVESFSPNLEPGLALEVQTSDRGLVHVHLGPLWFVERREGDLKPGDEVTIQGFCYKLAGKQRLIASEVTHKGDTLGLCDPQGIPYWEAWPRL